MHAVYIIRLFINKDLKLKKKKKKKKTGNNIRSYIQSPSYAKVT